MKLNIIKSAFVLSLIALGMTGCLKDDLYDDSKTQSTRPLGGQPMAIELKVSATNLTKFVTLAFNNGNNDTVVNLVPVTLAWGSPASEDINVTIGLQDTLVTSYNNNNGTAYDSATSSMFSLVNNGVVTIPKGSFTGYLQIKMKPVDFIGHDWALGFVIKSIDKPAYTISGNFNTAVVNVAIKNQYDGLYDVTGYFTHPSSPRAINIAGEKVKTFNATTITKALGDLGDATPVNIIINADNTVTVGPAPGATGSTALVNNYSQSGYPEYNNTYNPATKTFMLCYGYPMATPTSIPTRIIREKLVYTGPR